MIEIIFAICFQVEALASIWMPATDSSLDLLYDAYFFSLVHTVLIHYTSKHTPTQCKRVKNAAETYETVNGKV